VVGENKFSESKVEGLGVMLGVWESRPGVHRGAKACICGGCALDCNNKQVVAPKCVVRIDEGSGHKDFVLDGDGGQFAGSCSKDGQGFGGCRGFCCLVWEDRFGWEEVFFPGVRAQVEVEIFLAFRADGSFGDLVEGR